MWLAKWPNAMVDVQGYALAGCRNYHCVCYEGSSLKVSHPSLSFFLRKKENIG